MVSRLLMFLMASGFFLLACQVDLSEAPISKNDHLLNGPNDQLLSLRTIMPKAPGYSFELPPLIMVHGGGPGATSSFDLEGEDPSFAEELASLGYRIVLLNIRGWEKSAFNHEPSSKEDSLVLVSCKEAAEDIAFAIAWACDYFDVPEVNLFGWATGGHWTGYYMAHNGERVNKWVSLNSLYPVNGPWSTRDVWADPEDSSSFNFSKMGPFRVSDTLGIINKWISSIPIDDRTQWVSEKTMMAYAESAIRMNEYEEKFRVPGGYRIESFYMSLGYPYWTAADIASPALILRSDLDFWSRPLDLEAIEKDLIHPDSKTITLPGTHYLFLDKPEQGREQLLEAIEDFLRRESEKVEPN